MNISFFSTGLTGLTYQQSFFFSLLFHALIFFGYFENEKPALIGVNSGEVEVELVASEESREPISNSIETTKTEDAVVKTEHSLAKKQEIIKKVVPVLKKRSRTDTKDTGVSSFQHLGEKKAQIEGGSKSTLISAHPDYLLNPRPSYPKVSRKRGEEGLVVLHVLLDERGAVISLAVTQSSGFERLDYAALKAVRYWKFKPAKRFGVTVPDSVTVPVRFKLG